MSFPIRGWKQPASSDDRQRAIDGLEQGHVLLFAQLPFTLAQGEERVLSPAVGGEGRHKNISFDASTGKLRGVSAGAAEATLLRDVMERFAASSRALVLNLLPHYAAGLRQARTSYRPAEIAGRAMSWRKDDTRLHVDSFPSSPTRGTRILRVFSNVNPHGKSRTWRLGEPFEDLAQRYLPSLPRPLPGSSALLNMLGVTKSPRSAYDHFMLNLHDRMKADLDYQSGVAQRVLEFQPGSTWMVFTDQVSHAAMAGQYALEQTFHIPAGCMLDPSRAPLRVLERLAGRALA